MGVFTGIGPPCTFVAMIVGGTVSFTIVGVGVSSPPQPRRHTQMPMSERIVSCFIVVNLTINIMQNLSEIKIADVLKRKKPTDIA